MCKLLPDQPPLHDLLRYPHTLHTFPVYNPSCLGAFVFQIMDDYGGGMSVMWIAIFEVIGIMWFYGANNFGKDLNFMLNISMDGCCAWIRWVVIIGHVLEFTSLFKTLGDGDHLDHYTTPPDGHPWRLSQQLEATSLCWNNKVSLITVYLQSLYQCIRYPDWIHGIGYFLILIAVAQIPIWALFKTLYYLCAPSLKVWLTPQKSNRY